MPGYRKYNPKRKIQECPSKDGMPLETLCSIVRYGGNPEHKKNPGDFGLTPPSSPRSAKSLCDDVKVFRRAEALQLLKDGIMRGLVSEKCVGQAIVFPRNIWAVKVMEDGRLAPLEAQLENPSNGTYHGYPLPKTDPMHDLVLERWSLATNG